MLMQNLWFKLKYSKKKKKNALIIALRKKKTIFISIICSNKLETCQKWAIWVMMTLDLCTTFWGFGTLALNIYSTHRLSIVSK